MIDFNSLLSSSWSITCLLVSVVTILSTYFYYSKYRVWSKQGINGPRPVPLFGDFLDFFTPGSLLDKLEGKYKKYGSAFGSFTFWKPKLVVTDPEMIKDILVRDWYNFNDRSVGGQSGDPIFDNFLSVLKGNDWKRMRSIVSPTFTSGKMKSMFTVMNDCSVLMVNNIKKKVKKINDEKYELDMRHMSGCYTMDLIAKCCFATDTNSFEEDVSNPFVENAKSFSKLSKLKLLFIIIVFVMPARLRKMFNLSMFPAIDFFKNVSKTVLNQRRKDGSVNHYKDYLQLLIEASEAKEETKEELIIDNESHHSIETPIAAKDTSSDMMKRPLNDDEIISNSVLFFAVGYDTTGSLITLTTYFLTCNENAQNELFNEVYNSYKNNGNKFDYEAISGLKYLDAVISETLRLMPPAPVIERSASAEYIFKDKNIKIPKSCSIEIPIWNLHHEPKYWNQPEKFDPSRFLPENCSNIVPYTYLPFGGGPRNCVGMRFALLEAKLAIAHLVLHFKMSPCSKTDIPLDLSATIGLIQPKRVFVGIENRK